MKMRFGRRLRITTAFMLLLATSWSSEYAWATTQIHFWHAMTGHLNDAVDTLAKRFNEKQNAYEVNPLWKGTYPETLTAAIAAYRSKTPPHIVQVFEVGTQTVLLSGAIVPVFQLMKDQDLAIDWNNFIRPVLSCYSKDNRLYSMPFNSSTSTLYFHKEAFQKAGLNPDKPPTSWRRWVNTANASSALARPSAVSARDGPRGFCLRIWRPGMISHSPPSRTVSAVLTLNS
jgi:sn-glycerol 3-phosphate transport system substrate-binding protein